MLEADEVLAIDKPGAVLCASAVHCCTKGSRYSISKAASIGSHFCLDLALGIRCSMAGATNLKSDVAVAFKRCCATDVDTRALWTEPDAHCASIIHILY